MAVADNTDSDSPVVLFDGVCNLCEASVRWVIEHDPAGVFRFSPLQSKPARELIDRHRGQLHAFDEESLDSFIVVAEGQVFLRSDAWLYIVTRLPGFYRWLGILRWVPRPLRDRVYDFVGSHRYRWFGMKDACMAPAAEIRNRFLE